MNSSEEFKRFFNLYSETLRNCDCNCQRTDFDILEKYQLMPRQALYIFDWKDHNIPFQLGVQHLLGYSAEEFSPNLLAEYVHPDDGNRYVYLVRISNEWAREIKPEPFSVDVAIDYRVRRKDGRYIKVMRESTIFENCRDGTPRSSFNLLTDISGIKTDNSINLSITSLATGNVFLEDHDPAAVTIHFSARELEVLLRLKNGMNSIAIALDLQISRHTVDTHRRNMLAKCGSANVMEMVQLASRLGLI